MASKYRNINVDKQKKEIKNLVETIREVGVLSDKDIAKRIEVSYQYIWALRNERHLCGLVILDKLKTLLNDVLVKRRVYGERKRATTKKD